MMAGGKGGDPPLPQGVLFRREGNPPPSPFPTAFFQGGEGGTPHPPPFPGHFLLFLGGRGSPPSPPLGGGEPPDRELAL